MESNKRAHESGSIAIIGTRGYPSYYGGFETAVRKLAPFLAERGWEVTVYGRPGSTRGEDPELDPRVNRVITHGLETKSLSTLSYGLTSVLHAVVHKPDVALVMNVANGFWLPLLKLRGIPSIVNVDGIEWKRAKWGKVAKFVFKLGASLTAKFATQLVSDSIEIQRIWREEFGRNSKFIPYGGDNLAEYPPQPGLERRQYVLIVARFVPENTVEQFFEAVPEIAKHHKVVIVGSSGYGGALDAAAGNLEKTYANVTWLGHVSDDTQLLSLWQHAGVYFHGHSVGGTNPALVQAMACGSPVVARDTVYNREVLGELGHYVKPDAESIASAIKDAMSRQGKDELASKLKLRAHSDYSWTDVCARYEDSACELSKGALSSRRLV